MAIKKNKYYSYIVLSLSITGILLSYIISQQSHFGPIYKEFGEKLSIFSSLSQSVCGGEDSRINCDKVESSQYSKVLNIPLTSWGLFYFFLTAFFSFALAIGNTFYANYLFLFFWITVVASAGDVVLLFIMIFLIKSICPFCIITYTLNWSVLIILIKSLTNINQSPFDIVKNIKESFSGFQRNEAVNNIIICLFFVLFSAFMALGIDSYLVNQKEQFLKQKQESIINDTIKEFQNEDHVNFRVPDNSIIGNPDASVTIIEFSDFLCHHCKNASAILLSIVHENSDKVKINFVNFPLDINCNSSMNQQLHEGSCELAKGAICAAEQGKFQKYSETVYELNLTDVGPQQMKQIINYAGLNKSQFDACMIQTKTEAALIKQIETAKKFDINKVPVIFINGKRYRRKIDKRIIEKIIENEIRRAS